MRLLIAMLLAASCTAASAQTGTGEVDSRIRCTGGWCTLLAAHPSEDKLGLWLRVLASNSISKVTSVVINRGKQVLKSCPNKDLCEYLWPKSAMAITEEYTITVTAANGTKTTLLGKVGRP